MPDFGPSGSEIRRLGDFQILREIGRGGMGLFRPEWLSTGVRASREPRTGRCLAFFREICGTAEPLH
jgi:hypothetical protein